MPMGGGRGIDDGGFRLHPGSGHGATPGTEGNADTRMAAYPFHLPSVREGVDIQDAVVFSKPDGGLDWRPIPFETLQVEISLTHKGGEVWVIHGTAFLLDAVRMCAGTIVPGIRRSSVQHAAVGEHYPYNDISTNMLCRTEGYGHVKTAFSCRLRPQNHDSTCATLVNVLK